MHKFTDGKYNIGVKHEHVFLALMRFNNIKLHNLNIKNKASSVDFHLQNNSIYIELKYRQFSSNEYKTTLFDKKVDIWMSSKTCQRHVYISVLALLMVNITLSSMIKNYLVVLILSIL